MMVEWPFIFFQFSCLASASDCSTEFEFELMILQYNITIYYLFLPPFFSPFILVCEFSELKTFVSEKIIVYNWNTCSALRVSGVLIPWENFTRMFVY